jgi:cytidylate kinase
MRREEREPVITIDGPAGAGKGTVARALAGRLGYRVVDTGAMYRAVAWSVVRAGIAPDDREAVARHLASTRLEVAGDRVLVDGHDVTGELRGRELSDLTSRLSAQAAVRAKVTPLQRQLAASGGVVLEGRDTGTVVCPDADVKFYLDATLEARARRRHAELSARGLESTLDAVRREVEARDAQDRGRALAPLARAAGATEVDSTDLTVDEVVTRMLAVIEERRCCTPS